MKNYIFILVLVPQMLVSQSASRIAQQLISAHNLLINGSGESVTHLKHAQGYDEPLIEVVFPADFCSNRLELVPNLSPEKLPLGYNYPSIINENCTFESISYEDQIEKRALTPTYSLKRIWKVKINCANLESQEFMHIQHFNTSIV